MVSLTITGMMQLFNFSLESFLTSADDHLELVATQGFATVQRVPARSIHLANILHSQLSRLGPTISLDAIAGSHFEVISQLAPAAAPTAPAELAAEDRHRRQRSGQDPAQHHVAPPNPRREQEVPESLRHGQPRDVVHSVQVEEGVQPFRRMKITKQ